MGSEPNLSSHVVCYGRDYNLYPRTGPHLPASLAARSGLLTGSSPWTKSINRNEKGHFQVLFIKTTYEHSSLGLFYLSGMEASPREALDLYTGNDGTSLSLYFWMAHGKEMPANQLNCPGLLQEKEVHSAFSWIMHLCWVAGILLTNTTVCSLTPDPQHWTYHWTRTVLGQWYILI